MAEVWMFRSQCQDFPFYQRAFYIIVFEHHVFLETLDSVIALGALQFCEQDLRYENYNKTLHFNRTEHV
jgi:hypothetical protein